MKVYYLTTLLQAALIMQGHCLPVKRRLISGTIVGLHIRLDWNGI